MCGEAPAAWKELIYGLLNGHMEELMQCAMFDPEVIQRDFENSSIIRSLIANGDMALNDLKKLIAYAKLKWHSRGQARDDACFLIAYNISRKYKADSQESQNRKNNLLATGSVKLNRLCFDDLKGIGLTQEELCSILGRRVDHLNLDRVRSKFQQYIEESELNLRGPESER